MKAVCFLLLCLPFVFASPKKWDLLRCGSEVTAIELKEGHSVFQWDGPGPSRGDLIYCRYQLWVPNGLFAQVTIQTENLIKGTTSTGHGCVGVQDVVYLEAKNQKPIQICGSDEQSVASYEDLTLSVLVQESHASNRRIKMSVHTSSKSPNAHSSSSPSQLPPLNGSGSNKQKTGLLLVMIVGGVIIFSCFGVLCFLRFYLCKPKNNSSDVESAGDSKKTTCNDPNNEAQILQMLQNANSKTADQTTIPSSDSKTDPASMIDGQEKRDKKQLLMEHFKDLMVEVRNEVLCEHNLEDGSLQDIIYSKNALTNMIINMTLENVDTEEKEPWYYCFAQMTLLIDAFKQRALIEKGLAQGSIANAINVSEKIINIIINMATTADDEKDAAIDDSVEKETVSGALSTKKKSKLEDEIDVTFEVKKFKPGDIEVPLGYLDTILEMLTLIVTFQQPQLANERQQKQNHGKSMLLYGPPGTGKTLLAKLVAQMASMSFIAPEPAKLQSMYVGGSPKCLEKLFQTAKKHAPCIVFLDEIDTMMSDRDAEGASSHDKSNTNNLQIQLNKLSTEWKGVLVLGATNRPYAMGEAPLRRFGQLIPVNKPEFNDRKAIIKGNLVKDGGELNFSDQQLEDLANLAEGKSCSEIAEACSNALNTYKKECLKSTHFRKIGNYYEPCHSNDQGAEPMTYFEVGSGKLYPRDVTFQEVSNELKKNCKKSTENEDKKLFKFMINNE